jgi:hypothetical protein
LRGHLKCKGQNNEDKGYLKPTVDTKREPSTKKRKLPPEPLRSKSSNNNPPPTPKKKHTHTKQNNLPPKRRMKNFLSLQEFMSDG